MLLRLGSVLPATLPSIIQLHKGEIISKSFSGNVYKIAPEIGTYKHLFSKTKLIYTAIKNYIHPHG